MPATDPEPLLTPAGALLPQDAADMETEAWEAIRNILNDESQTGATRLRAAEYVLARRYGTPSSQAELIRAHISIEGNKTDDSGKIIRFEMPMNIEGTPRALEPAPDD